MSTSIAFFGSSLVSAYWNGAATYYRGLIKYLARLGYDITFYEPDAFDRQSHRDIEPPEWARVEVFAPTPAGVNRALQSVAAFDIVVKASGVGVYDGELLDGLVECTHPDALRIFWDVDAPATLADLSANPTNPLRRALPFIDMVFTYGGGDPVVAAYERLGARACLPIYNALDPETHFRAPPEERFACDLALLANRLPDREERIGEFFLRPASLLPDRKFLLAGAGWENVDLPPNVTYLGHVSTRDHNAFNSTPLAVLNVSRQSMASNGFSPATRVFEAAGAAACIITDTWPGIDRFLEPEREIFVAESGKDVVRILSSLTPWLARDTGVRARARIKSRDTYRRRAAEVDARLRHLMRQRREKEPRWQNA